MGWGLTFFLRGETVRPLTNRGRSVLALQIGQERLRHSKFSGGKHPVADTERQVPRRFRFQNLSCRMNVA